MEIDLKPNDVVGSYRLEHPIGYGAYGMVWKGHHEHLDQPVAIKVIDTRDLDAQNLERVKQECRIGGRLTHKERVVEVRDAFPEGDLFFIVMELMTGGSLERYLRDHPHPDLGLTLDWALDLCAALEEVHALGVIHRDVKPQNILLTDDAQVKLSDFGVAHLPESGMSTVYQPGTPGYRAPEQEGNQPVDGGADVYALCAVLFEVWSGRKYVRYKHTERDIVREEMTLLLGENYPDLSPGLRDRLMDAVLAGLRARPERIPLTDLQAALRTMRDDWKHGEPADKVTAAARAQVAQQLKSAARPTIVSNLPQWPVAARSRPPGRTALTEWLEDQFGDWYRHSPTKDVVLWFDPSGEWESLLDSLSPTLDLIHYQDSLLEVRYQLERRALDQLTVVYLPIKQEETDYLLPYHFTSHLFDKTLYDFLLDHGIPLPRSAQARGEIKAMLPQLVQQSVGQGADFWQGIDSVEGAWAALLPDFDGQLGRFLYRPQETWASLQQTGRADYFRAMIELKLGYSGTIGDPMAYAQGLLAHLCLIDLYWGTGCPDGFPLAHLLPDTSRFEACRSALTSWRYDSRYQNRFAECARTVESDYPGLVKWAQAHAESLEDPPLPGVAGAAWERTASEIAAWSSLAQAAAYTETHRARIRQAARGFWSTLGETPGWAALALADELMHAVEPALEGLSQLKSPAEVIRIYADEWWQIDRAYRICKSALEASFPGDTTLVKWVDRFYVRFLTETNQHWTELLSRQGAWGFPGVLPAQATFWEKAVGGGASRSAVFLVDALRYELGQTLRERLGAEYDVAIEAMVTGLPSTTPLGMSALLPGGEERAIEWGDDGWLISLPGFEGNLADKPARDKWLRAQSDNVEIVSLKDLLRPETTISSDVTRLIVTASQIDAIGENAGSLTPAMLDDLVEQVARGVRLAATTGFEEVHVVSDHGFLLLGRVADHGKAELPQDEWLKKSPRYAVGRDLPSTEHLRFPIPGSDDLLGCFPHGIICFKALGQYNFVHGGPALQEVVIPHVTVRPSLLSLPVGIEIEADDETHVAFFRVTLKPVLRGLVSLEREVRLALEREDGSVIRDSTEIIGVEDPIVKNLKVYPQDKVALGEALHITVYDARTQERLARHAIRFLVSSEL